MPCKILYVARFPPYAYFLHTKPLSRAQAVTHHRKPGAFPAQSSCHTDWNRNRLPSKEKTSPRSTPTYRPKPIFQRHADKTQKVLRRKKSVFSAERKINLLRLNAVRLKKIKKRVLNVKNCI